MTTPIPTTGNCETTYGGMPACQYARTDRAGDLDGCTHPAPAADEWAAGKPGDCPYFACDPAVTISLMSDYLAFREKALEAHRAFRAGVVKALAGAITEEELLACMTSTERREIAALKTEPKPR